MQQNKQNINFKFNQSNQYKHYDCLICLERVKKPISCLQCKKIICLSHVHKIENRCPFCRLTPFAYKQQATLQKIIDGIIEKERQMEKSSKIYQCLAIDCKFSGNYVAMLKHRKKYHSDYKIEEILYQQHSKKQTQKKKALLAIFQALLPSKIEMTLAFFASNNPKRPPPGDIKKVPSFEQAKSMVIHTRLCNHPECKKVWITQWGSYIGGEGGQIDFPLTMCPRGRFLNEIIGWIYNDPKH